MKPVGLADDIAAALDRAGMRAKRVTLLTTITDPTIPRATYRIDLDSGATVKARRMESEAATRLQLDLRATLPAAFAPILFRDGPILFEKWIDGWPLTPGALTEPLVREAGRLLAALHAAPPQAVRRSLSSDISTSDWHCDTLRRLRRLQASGALTEVDVRALGAMLESSDPTHARCGLAHHDFCGENMVVGFDGRLYVVDNERMSIDAFGMDIARTWYRWGLQNQAWDWFQDAYCTAGGVAEAFTQSLFWRIAAVTVSASIRLRAAHPGLAVPIKALRLLAWSGFD